MSSAPRIRFQPSIWRPATAPVAQLPAGQSFVQGRAWGASSLQKQADPRIQTLAGATMGTTWSLRLANPDYAPLAPVQALIAACLEQVVAEMSHWEPTSALSQFNRAPAGSWQVLPAQLARVLDAALHWAQACAGAWDPAIGALVNLWGFGPRPDPLAPHSGQPPSQAQIDQALQVSGYQRLQWNPSSAQLWQPGGLQLDLSGIAKGYAVDAAVGLLQQAGWQHGLLEIGGELRAWGCRPDGQPWRVAVAGQSQAGLEPALRLPLRAGALATSGDHWHSFVHEGRRYAHTLDPRTGWPVAHALTSVTVWHAECMHADALATVLTVLGPEAGWEFALRHGLAAVFHSHPSPGVPAGAQRATPAWDNLPG